MKNKNLKFQISKLKYKNEKKMKKNDYSVHYSV